MHQTDNFFYHVYEVVKLIPYGRVSTYGAIAAYLGAKSSARMVGWALNAATAMPDIPAHRVVNRKGLLSGKGHFPTPDYMESKLKSEGIEVENNQIKYFAELFWNPSVELL